MSTFSIIEENMSFELPPLPDGPPPLVRTYKAYCPYCRGMSTSYDPTMRVVPCEFCKTITIRIIQKHIRGFLVRKKLKKLKQKETIHRWFTRQNVNGADFSHQIHSFL